MTILRGQPALATDVLALVTGRAVASVAAAASLDLQASDIVTLQRWTSTSKFAPALYQKVISDPGNGAAFQDATGTWFENVEPVVTPEMFGAPGQPEGYTGPSYDDPAWQIAIDVQRPIRVMSPTYCFNTAPIIPSGGSLHIENGLATGQFFIYGTVAHSFTFGFVDFVHQVYIKGMGVDGGRDRLASGGAFPYAVHPPGEVYTFVAVMDLHADPTDTTSRADIIDCVFQNTHVYSWHLTYFNQVYDIGNQYIRTADHGCIACNIVVIDRIFKEWSSDNGVSVSRGCLRTTIRDSTFKDCEVAGLWVAGFNNAGAGTLTVTGVYTLLGTVTVVSSSGIFDASLVNTFLTPKGALDSKTCVIKVVGYTSPTTITAMVIIGDPTAPTAGVPGSLQATPSASWQYAPSLGNSEFTVTGNKVIGCYADGFAALTAARRGEVANNIICRTGVIADSEVSTLGSIAKGDTHIMVSVATGSNFPNGSYVIFTPPTSYTEYYIALVTNQSGDTLTVTPAAPDTYALETMHLAHNNTGSGFGVPINITGNAVGKHVPAAHISVHDNQILDFIGIAVRLGNAGNGGVINIGIERNKIFQPGAIGDGTSQVILLQEYPGTESDYICIRDNESDATTGFIKFSQQGSTPRRVILGPNYAPDASDYFTALDASAGNADVTANYLTSYQAALADPTGTSTPSPGVMMGFGASAHLIAQKTGIFDVFVSGNLVNATVGNSMLVSGRYSSAVSAPANGASPIGTVFCSALSSVTAAATVRSGFTLAGRCGASGDPQVPIGSTMWVDIDVVSPNSTLVSVFDVRITIRELDSDQITI